MKANIRELKDVLRDCLQSAAGMLLELEQALELDIPKIGRTNRSALLVAGLLENYYTCLETAFVRIAQAFENNLTPGRWHRDLLEKMTLHLEGIRVPAVSRENLPNLLELMKFRHFRRYYFEIEYNWKKIDFLVDLLRTTHPLVERDLGVFIDFLEQLVVEE
jgi:hypothetical protein